MSWKSHPGDSGTALAPHVLLDARLPIKNLQFWSILEAQAGNRKSATGRHRNSSAATRAHGRSFAIQKLSVLDCLWSCRARGGNLIPSTSETIAAPHEHANRNCPDFDGFGWEFEGMKIPVECTYVCVWSIWKHAFVCAKRVFLRWSGFWCIVETGPEVWGCWPSSPPI